MAVIVQAPSTTVTDAAARGLAIFDLDRTLIAGSSIAMYGRALAGAGLVRRSEIARHAVSETAFARGGLSGTTLERLCRKLLALAAGRDIVPLLDVAETAAPRIADRVYPGARLLIDHHRRVGDTVIVLSASPAPLVRALGPFLGADVTIGTEPEVADGRLTGRLASAFCHGEGKVLRLFETIGPNDLSTAVAYADAESDLPLLRASGRAVAVNPDRRLRAVATAAGWPVVSFR